MKDRMVLLTKICKQENRVSPLPVAYFPVATIVKSSDGWAPCHDLEESIKGIASLVNLFVFRPLLPVMRESLKHSTGPFADGGFGVAERHRYNDISASIIE